MSLQSGDRPAEAQEPIGRAGSAALRQCQACVGSDAAELPDGIVTFLLTDVEGGMRMWEESPHLMTRTLGQHDEVIDEALSTPTTESR